MTIMKSFFLEVNPMKWPLLILGAFSLVHLFRERIVSQLLPLSKSGTGCVARVNRHLLSPWTATGRKVFIAMWVFVLSTFLFFETYYQVYECKVSEQYVADNTRVLKTTLKWLNDHKIEHFAEFATLLTMIRGEGMIPWDQDSDFGVMNPGHSTVQTWIKQIEAETNCYTIWDADRNLLQLYENGYPKNGPHVDLWLFSQGSFDNGKEKTVYFDDPHFVINWRTPEMVLPPKKFFWEAMDMDVYVPAYAHAVSFLNYGPGYSVRQVFRADCIHNFVNGRLWW